MKIVDEKVMQVMLGCGAVRTVRVNLYEGKSLKQCLKMRGDIYGYVDEKTKKFIYIK